MQENFTSLELKDRIANLHINRPSQLNSLNKQVLQELQNHCLNLKENSNIDVVIVSGAGDKSFVAGADIKEMQDFKTNNEGENFSKLGSHTMLLLENLPQIVIAKVQGFALGGGLELALACDFIIASEKAIFGFPEVTLGLIPGFAGTQRLSRKIGPAKAIEWIASAKKYTAEHALNCGLISYITPHNELNKFTEEFSVKISKNSPTAIKTAKKVIQQGLQLNFEMGCSLESREFGKLFTNHESQEGIKAFIEKRTPNFI